MSGKKDLPELPPEWRKNTPLGEALRARYEDVLNEPVPEKLKQLIEELKKKEREEASGDEPKSPNIDQD
ncbi:MAG: NepR family anti-sigma factor [Hyphomonadaceae bacterium]|nr:NepR family anti-sigma factor [Hyphomonadaceae bacterium]